MNIDRTSIIYKEEKKTENLNRKIGDRTEDTMTIKKMEDTKEKTEIIESEETMEETIMTAIGQSPEGPARGLQASGSPLQATPRPRSCTD